MNTGIEISGLKEVSASIEALKEAVRRRYKRRALYQGAVVIRDAARELAPVQRGILKRSIIAATNNKDPEDRGEYAGYVTVKKGQFVVDRAGRVLSAKTAAKRRVTGKTINPRRYAHLPEYGTAHSAASPFLRPALRLRTAAAEQAIAESLKAQVVADFAGRLGAT